MCVTSKLPRLSYHVIVSTIFVAEARQEEEANELNSHMEPSLLDGYWKEVASPRQGPYKMNTIKMASSGSPPMFISDG